MARITQKPKIFGKEHNNEGLDPDIILELCGFRGHAYVRGGDVYAKKWASSPSEAIFEESSANSKQTLIIAIELESLKNWPKKNGTRITLVLVFAGVDGNVICTERVRNGCLETPFPLSGDRSIRSSLSR